MSIYPTFRDGNRTIDFILVYKTSLLNSEIREKAHNLFLENLGQLGMQLETETFTANNDIIFVKVYLPDKILLAYAGLFDIDLAFQSTAYRPYVPPPPSFMGTPLTNPDINDPLYSRAPETISGEIPKSITSAERIMVVNQILNRCIWGRSKGEYGIMRLIKVSIFIDAFPLHDGNYKWTESGPLNDRQILAAFWGTKNCWRKAQPLTLIERYFGTEYALYFAWLGMYIKLLIPAAILSILITIYGFATMGTHLNKNAKEICNSKIFMCPRCHFSKCGKEKLQNFCLIAYITNLFDNWSAVVFSAIMSIWATIFMEMWQRQEAVLQLQWNVRSLEYTISLRPQYIENATRKRYSPVTGKMVPYVPKSQTCYRYTVTFISITLLLFIMVAATFGVIVYRATIHLILVQQETTEIINNKTGRLIASMTGATMSACFIFVFKWLYKDIALKLTDMENHRTSHAYNNAYIYKSYALAFANNYAAVIYIAFFKGKFFTYPGDLSMWDSVGGVHSDVCEPTGCIVDLAILLIIIMTFKAVTSNVTQVVVPKIYSYINKTLRKVKRNGVPQWEQEFLMAKSEEFFIVDEYMDMVIQYGFVTFFILGFPLAPLFALLNNIVELRVDASKITKSYRRPVPTKVVGLGAWFGILQAMTYIGVVTNALVIAFTSNFIENIIIAVAYKKRSFIKQTLSEFKMSEFKVFDSTLNYSGTETCYYPGKRYPPDHKLRYRWRKSFWHHLGIKFAAVVIFEHIVIVTKGFLAYAIPDVPFSVQQQVIYEEKNIKKTRIKNLTEKFLEEREKQLKKK